MQKNYFLAVDYQFDFANREGKAAVLGDSPRFITDTLLPFLEDHSMKASEIVSDYRLPRGKSHSESCVPGTRGYDSLLPDHLRKGEQHIKCMHNPVWTRDNIGVPQKELGKEYQDPLQFDSWVYDNFPDKRIPVVLFGETMECCVLNVAQELYFRGYDTFVLYEATDPMPERQNYKEIIAQNSTLTIYAKNLYFKDLVKMYSF